MLKYQLQNTEETYIIMNKDDLELWQNQLAYNLMVIKALWKSKWNNYGESGIKGHEYDFSSLYRSIERGKETLRQYIQCNYSYKEKSMCDWANHIEAKTGIPHEYLTGEQRILLGNDFEHKKYPMYLDYLRKRGDINKLAEVADDMSPVFNTSEEIKQYAKENLSPKEQKNFFKITKEADATAKVFKLFEFGLAKESGRIMAIDTADLMQQNNRLCRLVYFIRSKKKYDGISIQTIDDMKTAIKKTRTPQLKDLGKNWLK